MVDGWSFIHLSANAGFLREHTPHGVGIRSEHSPPHSGQWPIFAFQVAAFLYIMISCVQPA